MEVEGAVCLQVKLDVKLLQRGSLIYDSCDKGEDRDS
jgi:hypothetical protein